MAVFPTWARFGWRDLSEQPEGVIERTQMEVGIPKQRRVASDVRVEMQLTVFFDTKNEAASFQTWFFTDISAGMDFFDFVHPLTGTTVQARVVNGELGPLSFINRTLTKSQRSLKIEYWRASW